MSSVSASMPAPPAAKPAKERLMSIDALRGFDMYWITGGGTFTNAVVAWIGWKPLTDIVVHHTDHVGWEGFTMWDAIFPLFLFLSGTTMPYSLLSRLEKGESKKVLFWRVFRRMLLLIFLGMMWGVLHLQFRTMRYPSVLGLIGIAYFIAAVIVINCNLRRQFVWLAGILIGYYLGMRFIPLPDTILAGRFTPGGTVASFVDYYVLPGTLYQHSFDPEGLLAAFSASAMALLGAIAGQVLRTKVFTPYKKIGVLIAGGLCSIVLALIWSQWFPIIKGMWTSSYILFAGGLSSIILSIAYLIVDVWGFRKIPFIFAVVGMNSITIYVGRAFIDFHKISEFFFGGLASVSSEMVAPIVVAFGVLLSEWIFLYYLYSKKTFLRV